MITLAACVTGFILDLIMGDPRWLYHPVRLIGLLITITENGLRYICKASGKDQKAVQMTAGLCLWVIVVVIATGVPMLALYEAGKVSPWLRYLIESFWCYQILATKSLKQESMKVYRELQKNDLPSARKAVAMIVGRDTQSLSTEGVVKATVETIAENTTDGVISPLFYMIIGGAPLAFFYKAVNTMDSMVGYKNEKYLHFGHFPALLDDIFNYIPARIAAYLMMGAAYLLKMDWVNAHKVYQRDRYNHASPNAAQTEAVCAGALGVQLAGDAYYFGKLYQKETIGDAGRPIVYEDIKLADRLLYTSAWIALVLFSGLKYLVLLT